MLYIWIIGVIILLVLLFTLYISRYKKEQFAGIPYRAMGIFEFMSKFKRFPDYKEFKKSNIKIDPIEYVDIYNHTKNLPTLSIDKIISALNKSN
jgi:hypothetical protein